MLECQQPGAWAGWVHAHAPVQTQLTGQLKKMFTARRAIGAGALTFPVWLKIRRQVPADRMQMFMNRLLFIRSFSEQIQIIVCKGFRPSRVRVLYPDVKK